MHSVCYALRIRHRIEREMRTSTYEGEYAKEVAFQTAVDQAVLEEVKGAQRDVAEERELFGGSEDTPCIQTAGLWGTGEGRYHGVI